MSEYKVPQDVEADDKLLGPFSFRQFIYLGIAAGLCAIGWALAQLFIGLVLIPLPFILLFGALALPLRKDQPMEIYLAAIVSFYLKPRKRLWVPDGVESLVEITVPKTVEHSYTKEFDQEEAARRLNYLSKIVDSHGWAVRGETASPMTDEAKFEAENTPDYMGDTAGLAQNFDRRIAQTEAAKKAQIIANMKQPQPEAIPQQPIIAPIADPYASLVQQQPQPVAAAAPTQQSVPQQIPPRSTEQPTFNPYPSAMQQTIIAPVPQSTEVPLQQLSVVAPPLEQPAIVPKSTSKDTPSAGIIDLASNHNDVSVETLARMAKEVKAKEKAIATFDSANDEAFVSFR